MSSSPEDSATYDPVSLARVLRVPLVQERNVAEGGRYVTGSRIPSQVEQVVLRSAPSQGIRTVGFCALWPLAGPQLSGSNAMNRARSVNERSDLRPAFAAQRAGSLLEIDAWMPSEVSAISPLVERLMRLIEGSHCIAGEEHAVQLALREALNNAVVHGNRQDAHKLVHVRCRCRVGKGISLIVSDQGQGFDASAVPDPTRVERLEAEHGRGIHIMKLAMDQVWFEQRGAAVHMFKGLAGNPSADLRSDSRGF